MKMIKMIKLPSAICKRKDKILKIQNIYFENVFIREKIKQNQIKNHTNCLVTSIPH